MKTENSSKLQEHRGIVLIIALGLLLLAGFFFLWINPALKSIKNLDGRIADLRLEIEKQKELLPLYVQLQGIEKTEIPQSLTLPAGTKIPRSEIHEIDSVISLFKGIVDASGLKMSKVTPDLSSLEEKPAFMTAEVVVTGPFYAFREFLLQAAKVSYIQKIEVIFLKQMAEEKEMTVKLWCAVE